MAGRDGGGGTDSARRRRERRLRSMLRHERVAVAMATPHEERSLPQSSGRRRSTSCTTAHGTEATASGRAAGQPCGARAAAERPQPAVLCGGLPPDPWPACAGRGVG